MLTEGLIERYSRQILLPEVGGRGQERLCATTITVAGGGGAAAVARDLLAAAGVRVDAAPDEPGTLRARVGAAVEVVGRRRRGGAVVATLVGRPCGRCVAAEPAEPEAGDPAAEQALGALVAAEALSAALGLVHGGRMQTLDLVDGAFRGAPIAPTAGCGACAAAP